MATFATFNPVSEFQSGRSNARTIQAQEQGIAREQAAAPVRNQLADLQLSQAKVGAQRESTEFGQQQALSGAKILNQSLVALRGLPPEQREQAFASIRPQLEQFDIDLSTVTPENLTDSALDQGITKTQALIGQPAPEKGFTLSPGQERFGPGGESIASVAPKPVKSEISTAQAIPDVLLKGLSPDLAEKGAAAFSAAGGGKDGMTAFQKIVDKGTEQQRRLASPGILKANFPQASRAEQAQLQGAMDAAKTTESGLVAAGKVRVEQQRIKKAKVFQNRGIALLDSILANAELADVVGSIEGSDESVLPFGGKKIRSDGEANAIADIEEAGNIFTAENLKLMSGVLSETDIKILSNLAGGALNRLRSEERFVTDVTEMRDRLASQIAVTVDERDAENSVNTNEQALAWANANPNDPRAAAILAKIQGNQ